MNQDEYSSLLTIANNLDDAMFLIDRNGKVKFCNNAELKAYRCTRGDFQKYYSNIYYLPEYNSKSGLLFDEVMETKSEACRWQEIIDKKNVGRMYLVYEKPILDSDGNVKYVIGTMRRKDKIEKEYLNSQQQMIDKDKVQLVVEIPRKLHFKSEAMAEVVELAERVSKLNVHVLLHGETGVGKDMIANYIHDNSSRNNKEMISINCASLSPSLFESELFGYEKGAFTGARPQGHLGLIEASNHGTLFLDEIDSIPFDQQGKILQVLETKTFRRVGTIESTNVDFRLIAATNKDLQSMVQSNKFREDLYYRLNVFPISIPPLRERPEDIRCLAEYFLGFYCSMYGYQKTFSDSVYQQLESYDWPGNVRELRNFVERTIITSDVGITSIDYINIPKKHSDLKRAETINETTTTSLNNNEDNTLKGKVCEYEKQIIENALERFGSTTQAASYLGISMSTISRKISHYDIKKFNW